MDFGKRVKDVLTTGAAKTRDLYSRARSGAKGLSEQAVLALEISQLGKDMDRKYTELGTTVFKLLSTPGKASVSRSAAGVKPIMDGITTLLDTVAQKKKQLAAMKRGGAEGK